MLKTLGSNDDITASILGAKGETAPEGGQPASPRPPQTRRTRRDPGTLPRAPALARGRDPPPERREDQKK